MGLVLGDVLATVGGASVTAVPVHHTHTSSSSGSVETVVVLDLPTRCRVIVMITDPDVTVTTSNQVPSLLIGGVEVGTWGHSGTGKETVGEGQVTIATKRNYSVSAASPSFRGVIYYWPEKE